MTESKRKKLLQLFCVSALLIAVVFSIKTVYAAKKYDASAGNTFTAASSADPVINETTVADTTNEGYILEKKDVTVTNTADYSVYARASIIVTWQDKYGNTYCYPPTDSDYSISFNESDWTYNSSDGLWYYNSVIEPNDVSSSLITECKPLAAAPVDGYTLNVNIAAQTIQAAGTTDSTGAKAAIDAWGYLSDT